MDIDCAVRARCLEIIRDLPIPDPWDERVFLADLARQRGRPIELRPVALPLGAPCGLLVGTPDADFIVHSGHLSQVHAEHIDMHEVGHLLLGHHGDAGDRSIAAVAAPAGEGGGQAGGPAAAVDEDLAAALAALLPALSPELIRLMLGRTVYQDREEREAETFASLLMTEILHRRPRRGRFPADLADHFAAVPVPRSATSTPRRWVSWWTG